MNLQAEKLHLVFAFIKIKPLVNQFQPVTGLCKKHLGLKINNVT